MNYLTFEHENICYNNEHQFDSIDDMIKWINDNINGLDKDYYNDLLFSIFGFIYGLNIKTIKNMYGQIKILTTDDKLKNIDLNDCFIKLRSPIPIIKQKMRNAIKTLDNYKTFQGPCERYKIDNGRCTYNGKLVNHHYKYSFSYISNSYIVEKIKNLNEHEKMLKLDDIMNNFDKYKEDFLDYHKRFEPNVVHICEKCHNIIHYGHE